MLLPANILNHIKTGLGMRHDSVRVDNALAVSAQTRSVPIAAMLRHTPKPVALARNPGNAVKIVAEWWTRSPGSRFEMAGRRATTRREIGVPHVDDRFDP
jgi:hypothetical protein